MASLLVTVFALTYAVSSPFWGAFADRYPRRVIAVSGLLLFQAGDVSTALQPSFPWLILSRALAAAGAAGFTPTLYAYIADTTPLQKRAGAMSIASAGFSSATFLGIPLGLIIANIWNWPGAFWMIFVFSVISSMITWTLWTPSSLTWSPRPPSALPSRALTLNYTLTTFAFASFGAVYTYLPLDLSRHFHFTAGRLTLFMMVFGLFGLMGTLAAGYLSDRIGHLRVVRWGILLEILLLLGLRHHWTGNALWASLLLFSMVTSYTPVLKALASAKGAKGLALSWNNAAMYFGISLGSWGMGMVWAHGMPAIYLGAATFTTIAWVIALWIRE